MKNTLIENLKEAKNFLEDLGLKTSDTQEELRKRDLQKLANILTKDVELDLDGDKSCVYVVPFIDETTFVIRSNAESMYDWEEDIKDIYFNRYEDKSGKMPKALIHTINLLISDLSAKTVYLNYTPHTINLNSGEEFESKGVARVSSNHTEIINNECKVVYGEVEGLPAPQEGVKYIVSLLVLQASDRTDLVAPASGHPDTVRNDKGHIVSVPCFITK